MTVIFQTHLKYKDSRVEWLGHIPNDWNIVPFKSVFRLSREKNGSRPIGEMLSVSGYRGIELKEYESKQTKRDVEELADYRVVRIGQLVVNTMWLNYAGLGISDLEGYVSPAYRCYEIIYRGANKRFLHHLLRSPRFIQRYTSLLYGIRPNSLQIKTHDFERLQILLPSPETQQRISDFLDKKTQIIDKLINKKQRLMELLREKRTALITRAVTKGLDPNAKLRPSGIQWLGGIPEGWEIKPLKFYFIFEKGENAQLYTKEYTATHAGEFPVYSGQTEDEGVLGKIDTYDYDEKQVVFVTTVGAKAMTPMLLRGKFSLSQNCLIMVPKNDRPIDYFFYQMFPLFAYERASIPSHMQPSLRKGDLNAYRVAVPSAEIQKKITHFLDEKTAVIDRTIKMVEKNIENLKEYRSSLIYSAVTGKIKV